MARLFGKVRRILTRIKNHSAEVYEEQADFYRENPEIYMMEKFDKLDDF